MQYELREDFWCFGKMHRELGSGAKLYDSHNTISIMVGDRLIWWWRPEKQHQEIKQETQAVAQLFGNLTKKPEEFTLEKMSPGRLIRAFMTHYLKLEINSKTNNRFYGDRFYYLVKTRPTLVEQGDLEQVRSQDEKYGFDYDLLGTASHWHYLYLAPEPYGQGIELDIKSAYFTAFLKQPTMLLNDPGVSGQSKPFFVGDGGAMQRLRDINPKLPKWFRLQLLGILGSHQHEYYQFEPGALNATMKINTGGIKYGFAFNAAHKAIYTVYKAMAEVANLVKDDLLRSHTDSFILKATMSRSKEAEMLSALADRGFTVSCKGIGWAQFRDIDHGIHGFGKPKGNIQDLEEWRKENGVWVKPTSREIYERWSHWLPPIPDEIRASERHYEFVSVSSMERVSPEKLAGYWRNDW